MTDCMMRHQMYIIIAGPTASGKSQLALDLAKNFNGAVINADSMQLYSDLSILTARPQRCQMQDIPHHLFGIYDASYRASVAEWLKHAAAVIKEVRALGQLPIIVGGTGMYLQAGLRGIAPVPNVPASVYRHCLALYKNLGGKEFRNELAKKDPEIAGRLVDGDSQRLIRAMSVALGTCRPLSWWQRQPHKGAFLGRPLNIAIIPSRSSLYERIDRRFDGMVTDGAINEVRSLIGRGLDPSLPLMKALGVGPLAAFLRGEMSEEEAKYVVKRQTRRYAKRQMTWIRNNFNAQMTLQKKYSERIHEKIFSLIR